MAVSEPKFIPKPGQVDYTNIRYAPVVNVVVAKDQKILLVQRSAHMRLYPGYWSGVSGFLDDSKSIEQKAYEELSEEVGINAAEITSFQIGEVLLQEAPEYHKTWITVPVLVKASTKDFKLNWEGQKAQWFSPSEIGALNLVPGFDNVIQQFTSEL